MQIGTRHWGHGAITGDVRLGEEADCEIATVRVAGCCMKLHLRQNKGTHQPSAGQNNNIKSSQPTSIYPARNEGYKLFSALFMPWTTKDILPGDK